MAHAVHPRIYSAMYMRCQLNVNKVVSSNWIASRFGRLSWEVSSNWIASLIWEVILPREVSSNWITSPIWELSTVLTYSLCEELHKLIPSLNTVGAQCEFQVGLSIDEIGVEERRKLQYLQRLDQVQPRLRPVPDRLVFYPVKRVRNIHKDRYSPPGGVVRSEQAIPVFFPWQQVLLEDGKAISTVSAAVGKVGKYVVSTSHLTFSLWQREKRQRKKEHVQHSSQHLEQKSDQQMSASKQNYISF